MEYRICCIQCGTQHEILPEQCSCGRTYSQIVKPSTSIEDYKKAIDCHEYVTLAIVIEHEDIPADTIEVQMHALIDNESKILWLDSIKKKPVSPNKNNEFDSIGDFILYVVEQITYYNDIPSYAFLIKKDSDLRPFDTTRL